jgi:hypothetical protein
MEEHEEQQLIAYGGIVKKPARESQGQAIPAVGNELFV